MQKLANRLSLDRTVILLLITAAIGLGFFSLMAILVQTHQTVYFDDLLLTSMRRATDLAKPVGPPMLLNVAKDVTALGDYTVLTLVTLFTLGYCLMTRYYTAFFMVFVAVNSGDLLMVVLKDIFRRQRPEIVPHLVEAAYTSFPSGHAMMSALVYLTIGAILARIEARKAVKIYLIAAFAFLSFLIGISRVFLGVHYPSDVIAGWLAGITWGTLSAAAVLTVSKKVKSKVHEQ